MTTTFLQLHRNPPKPPDKLTVEQYHLMLAHGILEEGAPLELIDGHLVSKNRSAVGEDPMTVGNYHMWVVKKLAALDPRFHRFNCHLQTQQPISLPPFDEPEPDAAIILGTTDDYLDHKPTAADVLAVIEVSDSSLRYDRTTKLSIYAKVAIPLYIIINLQENQAEVYSEPNSKSGRFGRTETLHPKQSLHLPTATGKTVKVPVRSLLP